MTNATLTIEGMSCEHCVNAVRRALSALPTVEIQTLAVGKADVRFDDRLVDGGQLVAALGEAGYRATLSR